MRDEFAIKMDRLHFNRYRLERSQFLPILEAYEKKVDHIGALGSPKDEEAAKEIEAFFGGGYTEQQIWDAIFREDGYRRLISFWEKEGAAIFSFREELIEMLLKTDVDSVPAQSLAFPYDRIYVHLGDADPIPDLDENYRIDGFYLQNDSLARMLGHGRIRSADEIRREHQETVATAQRVLQYRHQMPEHSIKWAEEALVNHADVNKVIAEAITHDTGQKSLYDQLMQNPDDFDYEKEKNTFMLLTVDFTLARKDGKVKALTPAELVAEPFVRCWFDFETHRVTVKEAIENLFRDGIMPTELHFESFVDEAGNYCDTRKNSFLNVTNRPEHLTELSMLVFNTICYLNWKDRDVVFRYPNKKIQEQVDRAKSDKQKKWAAQKAKSLGYRRIHFCGYATRYDKASGVGNGITVKSHWRRGHWRNQPYGKALSQTKLLWIRPVLVNQQLEDKSGTKKTVYSVD